MVNFLALFKKLRKNRDPFEKIRDSFTYFRESTFLNFSGFSRPSLVRRHFGIQDGGFQFAAITLNPRNMSIIGTGYSTSFWNSRRHLPVCHFKHMQYEYFWNEPDDFEIQYGDFQFVQIIPNLSNMGIFGTGQMRI